DLPQLPHGADPWPSAAGAAGFGSGVGAVAGTGGGPCGTGGGAACGIGGGACPAGRGCCGGWGGWFIGDPSGERETGATAAGAGAGWRRRTAGPARAPGRPGSTAPCPPSRPGSAG